jgi:hypothetical protein
MSLTSGLHCPRTPLRRFLDRELSAGAHHLRKSFRARDQSSHILMPGPGVGTEAGNVGTAIDCRLRLAFTAAEPVDHVASAGILLTGTHVSDASRRMHVVGQELAARVHETVLRLQLDNRELPMDRAHDEEEDLARLLIAAAWYQVNYRNAYGFAYTPLAITAREDPASFTLERLLELPHGDMVADVVAQLYKAADGPLDAVRGLHARPDVPDRPDHRGRRLLRRRTAARLQKHPKYAHDPPGRGVAVGRLLDTDAWYRVDTLGLYLTRSGTLAAWPVEEYLELLGPAAASCRSSGPPSPSSSKAARLTSNRTVRTRKTRCAGSLSAWRPSPSPATALCVPGAARNRAASAGSSARHRPSCTRDTGPAASRKQLCEADGVPDHPERRPTHGGGNASEVPRRHTHCAVAPGVWGQWVELGASPVRWRVSR